MDAKDIVGDLATNFAGKLKGELTSDENIDMLLDTVLKSRVQRKAKDIVRDGINYILFIVVLLQTSPDITGSADDNLSTLGKLYYAIMMTSFGNIVGVSLVFILLLSLFIFWHAVRFHPCLKAVTNHEVESAYEATNEYPAIDGFLELSFPYRFKGSMWALPYFVLAGCVSIISLGLVVYLDEYEHVTKVTSGALGASAIELLVVATDFSEYWVHTRNQTLPDKPTHPVKEIV